MMETGHRVIHGDCLDVMPTLPDKSIDMILCDLPYGTTYCKWDSVIPLKHMWMEYRRIIKDTGPIVLTASQPFTSSLVMSNPSMFRCEWIWDKVNAANFANANKQPLKVHESVLVFSSKQPTYNPQKTQGPKNHIQGRSEENNAETRIISKRVGDDISGMKYPKSIQVFPKHSSQCGLHPTQKPVAMCEYFIRTYTNEGDTVLDSCAGSGTTGVACMNTGRKFILIEKDEDYYLIAKERLQTIAPALIF